MPVIDDAEPRLGPAGAPAQPAGLAPQAVGEQGAAVGPSTVVVTGASRGIGAGVAAAFGARGARVIGVSRSGEAPQGVIPVAADVTEPACLEAAIGEHAPAGVDVLVAAAGIAPSALAARTSPALWQDVIDTNLTGAFNAAHAVLPGMMAAKRGRIILLSSVIAARGGVGLAAYGASKAGIEGLTRSLARETASRGITVNAVAPGFIDTGMTADLPDAVRDRYREEIPAGAFGSVADVVGPVLFLASPEARYITGAVIPVDGGMGMGR